MRIEIPKDARSLGVHEGIPRLIYAGLSDIGLVRPNNEDVWAAYPESGFFALADGMGGHQAGEIAAKEAIEQLLRSFKPGKDPTTDLQRAIELVNLRVYEKGRSSEQWNGMGTTLCCLYWGQKTVIYAHVGDSRIYRYRKEKLEQLTQDHSLFSRWQMLGKTSHDPYPYKNVITRAIGTARKVIPEISAINFESGDLFLLCSDGLSDALTTQDMEKVIQRSETALDTPHDPQTLSKNLQSTAFRLVEKAKIMGSSDNITVLLIQSISQ